MSQEQNENESRTGKGDKKAAYFIGAIVLNLLMTTTSLFIYHHYVVKPKQQSVQIVGVDLKGYMEKQKSGMMNNRITEEQFKANMDKLEATVNELGKTKIVMMADVILRGAEIIELP